MRITIATCKKFPDLTPSDAILAEALRARGVEVSSAPWNGAFAPFGDADLVLIRTTWDYFDVVDEFSAWIDRLEKTTPVLNPPDILHWNMTKAYLFELAERSAPVPPLIRVARDADAIAGAMDTLGLEEAIVKPLAGGTASGLSKVRRDDGEGLARAAAKLNGDGLVQAFLPEIATIGETSMVFLGGEFSHAVVKMPKSGDIRVQEEHGGTSRALTPPAWAIAEARDILAMCPGKTAYGRVDAIVYKDRMSLMEVELVEPELFFAYCPEGAVRLAGILAG